MTQALQFLLLIFAGWVHREQQKVIEYLRAESHLLKSEARQATHPIHGCRTESTRSQGQGRGPKGASRTRMSRIAGHRFYVGIGSLWPRNMMVQLAEVPPNAASSHHAFSSQ